MSLQEDEEFLSVAESLDDFHDPNAVDLTDLDDDDDNSKLHCDTSTDSDKPAISDDDLELVAISSDEDADNSDENDGLGEVRLQRLRQLRFKLPSQRSPDEPIPSISAVPLTVEEVFHTSRLPETVTQVERENPVVAEVIQVEDANGDDEEEEEDEFERLRLQRLHRRCERSAPERDFAEDDTETAEFQSRLRKLSNPSLVPVPQQQEPSKEEERKSSPEPVVERSRNQRSSGAPEREIEEEDKDSAVLQSSLRRSKSHDLFEQKRRQKAAAAAGGGGPIKPGRRGSWHLESVDELSAFPGNSDKLVEEDEEVEEEPEEKEEKKQEAKEEVEEKPNEDVDHVEDVETSVKDANGSPPRLFRYWIFSTWFICPSASLELNAYT